MKKLANRLRHLLLVSLGLVASFGAQAKSIDFDARLATPVVQAGRAQTAFLKVALTGFELQA